MDQVRTMSAHDRHLAAYRAYTTSAWCDNPTCAEYGQAVIVDYEEEYGQGSIQPEECPDCGAELSLDAPARDEREPDPDPGPSDAYDPKVDYPERYTDGPY